MWLLTFLAFTEVDLIFFFFCDMEFCARRWVQPCCRCVQLCWKCVLPRCKYVHSCCTCVQPCCI